MTISIKLGPFVFGPTSQLIGSATRVEWAVLINCVPGNRASASIHIGQWWNKEVSTHLSGAWTRLACAPCREHANKVSHQSHWLCSLVRVRGLICFWFAPTHCGSTIKIQFCCAPRGLVYWLAIHSFNYMAPLLMGSAYNHDHDKWHTCTWQRRRHRAYRTQLI